MTMTTRFTCDQKDRLIAFLYDEIADEERQLIGAHLDQCRACCREVGSLRDVRGHFSAWTPPEPALGFRVVRDEPARVLRPRWRSAVWGLGFAAAAALVLAAGAAVANLEVRYDAQGFTVRTGWGSGSAAPTVSHADLQALESRLRKDLPVAPAGTTPVAGAPEPARTAVDEAAIVRRVSALIGQSEARQQRELALRLTQVVRDVDQQRRADWVRIAQGFGRLEDLTGAGVMQQREMMNYLMRVSQRDQR